jgi:hypothetical protein
MSAYNEAYDQDGRLRPAYADFQNRTGYNAARPSTELQAEIARRGIRLNCEICPRALIINEQEFQTSIAPGVIQRALALQNLFADIALTSTPRLAQERFNGDDLGQVLCTAGVDHGKLRSFWQGQPLDQIRFVYGPDLVRNEYGQWTVLEDNIGCIGGVTTAEIVQNAFLSAIGVTAEQPRGMPDLSYAIRCFLRHVGLRVGDDGVFGISPASVQSSAATINRDQDHSGKIDILRSLGVSVIEPERLLEKVTTDRPSVASIINLSSTMTKSYCSIAEAAFANPSLPVFGAPYVEVIAAKAFLSLGEEFIPFYMNQPAILPVPPTRLVRGGVGDLSAGGVLKRSAGQGGGEVFFLDNPATRPPRERLEQTLESWGPYGAIIQTSVDRSILSDFDALEALPEIVEIRPIVYVYGYGAALVSNAISGRAVPARRNALGNISQGARFLPVLRGTGAVDPISRSSDNHKPGKQR